MPLLKVIRPGFQTTIQDLGRPHFAHFGVSASGVADPVSFRIGNLLVGNDENAAALEMTLVGGEFEFEAATLIALTGFDFQPKLDDKAVPLWTSIHVHPGQILTTGSTRKGARCFLAIQGGFLEPTMLGSASTHIITGMGGYKGRPLQRGDILEYPLISEQPFTPRIIGKESLENLFFTGILRVTEGPQIDSFPPESCKLFSGSVYCVSEDSNRMGIRLLGPSLGKTTDEDIITEGVSLGAIQISHDGKPIILFVEHQTTGGYPKIANVISADLHKIGHLRPRDEVQFEFVSLEEAQTLLVKLESYISRQTCPK